MNIMLAPASLVLRPGLAGIRMTPEEFDAVQECDPRHRYELVNGVLVVTPPPLEAERDPNGELEYMLRRYRDDNPQGRTLDKTLAEQMVRTRTNRRRAGRVIWAGLGRVPDPAVDVPTIVVEFVSADRRDWLRDYVDKLEEYMDLGVAEYWIIDRFRRTMTVVRNRPRGRQERVVRERQTYQTPLLPGFKLRLAQLFAQSDDWQ
jgi:Uma2 family endonuclease